MRRIVITGMGAISACGMGANALWEAVRDARSGIAPLVSPDPTASLRMKVAAQVKDFDPAPHFDQSRLGLLDRTAQMALLATREAVAQSGIEFGSRDLARRTATVIGTGVGGELARDEQSRKLYRDNSSRVHPLTIVRIMPNAPASHVSMELGATGPAFGVVSACASSNHAIIQGASLIRSGLADAAIVGGTEACFSLSGIRAWEAMRVVADDTCRPFCKQRRGLVLGEGSGAFVLEILEHARARGATILAELAGCGMSADAGDIVAPSGEGAASAMRMALEDARLAPEQGLHQCPRHRHAGQRPHRVTRDPRGVRQARRQHRGVLDQGRAWPCSGCVRRAGTGRGDRSDARGRDPADRELHRSRSRVRPGLRAQCLA